jgi:hypothetical protein
MREWDLNLEYEFIEYIRQFPEVFDIIVIKDYGFRGMSESVNIYKLYQYGVANLPLGEIDPQDTIEFMRWILTNKNEFELSMI